MQDKNLFLRLIYFYRSPQVAGQWTDSPKDIDDSDGWADGWWLSWPATLDVTHARVTSSNVAKFSGSYFELPQYVVYEMSSRPLRDAIAV